ncbi:MAG: DNA-protecting protein DprA [Lachnospiraceae bacterium]|nr:DNA-protecting protein DprA [Lachnospiraceae bacterium]
MNREEKKYAYWLCNIPGIGEKTIRLLLARFKSPGKVYTASEAELSECLNGMQLKHILEKQSDWKLQEEYEKLFEKGIGVVFYGEREYPRRLLEIPDAPYALFYKGSLPKEEVLSVAVIGARECSGYGEFVATQLGRYLGEQGIQVISGMARGIDGISQMAAMEAGGTSYGVLGSGVDVCYPKSNQRLYDRLLKQGGVLSAYVPGALPASGHFPPRNRIVSGLADALVVVEARGKSGTLITVDMALEQGKEVFVVPGRITDRLSDGCNRLLTQGAGVFLTPGDFVSQLKELAAKKGLVEDDGESKNEDEMKETVIEKRKKQNLLSISKELRPVYKQLEISPKTIEQILCKMPAGYHQGLVSAALMRLCMDGYAKQVSPGQFVLS